MPVGIHLFGTETRITVRSLTANDRSALIRLAHTRPDLRSVLLPILKNAVSGKAQKPELDFADAYYEMADGITAVKMAAKNSKDPELVKLAAKVDQAGNALHAYLERTYLWD